MINKTTFIITRTVSNFLIIGSLVFLTLSIGPILKEEAYFYYRQWRGATFTLSSAKVPPVSSGKSSPFSNLIGEPTPTKITPLDTDFGLVIEKLGVNAPVVANVDSAHEKAYFEALRHGVAHAKGTALPGQVGNSYLFAHSALDFWNFGKYAMVFTLLNKLEPGDRIVTFYKGRQFNYVVIDKEVVPGFNTQPLLRSYDEPILTLQTCDPPGTALNRLVVTARLVLP